MLSLSTDYLLERLSLLVLLLISSEMVEVIRLLEIVQNEVLFAEVFFDFLFQDGIW